MNHDTAVHVDLGERGSGWHYATLNRRTGGYPVGYCAEHPPHPTENEARACYRRYQRDHITLDARTSSWHGCEYQPDGEHRCDAPTKTGARSHDGWHYTSLCDDHLTYDCARDALGFADELAGDSWHS